MSTTIIERPSPLFKGPLLDAIRRGDKTQTRRVMKGCLGPRNDRDFSLEPGDVVLRAGKPYLLKESRGRNKRASGELTPHKVAPPHGGPGTVWYLKEGLARRYHVNAETPYSVYADGSFVGDRRTGDYLKGWKWQRDTLTSMYMPRYAARDFLTVTDVRVERVQDISAMDAIDEGIAKSHDGTHPWYKNYGDSGPANFKYLEGAIKSFASLWDSINGKNPGCSWSDNPWVFVYTFDYTRDVGRAMP